MLNKYVTIVATCCGMRADGVLKLVLKANEQPAGDDVLNVARVKTRLFHDLMKVEDHTRVVLDVGGYRQLLIPICEHTRIFDACGKEVRI